MWSSCSTAEKINQLLSCKNHTISSSSPTSFCIQDESPWIYAFWQSPSTTCTIYSSSSPSLHLILSRAPLSALIDFYWLLKRIKMKYSCTGSDIIQYMYFHLHFHTFEYILLCLVPTPKEQCEHQHHYEILLQPVYLTSSSNPCFHHTCNFPPLH